MQQRFTVSSFIITVLTLVGTLASTSLSAKGRPPGPAPAVTITQPQLHPLSEPIQAIGTLQANQSVDITPQVNGRIAHLNLIDGGSVKKSQRLVQLDQREQTGKIREIEVTLKDQQRKLSYMETLFKQKAISKDELDAQQAQVDIQAANLTTEKAVLNYYTLTAPFDGILGFNNTSTGTLINSGTTITTLDDISRVKLDINLPETVLSEITPGTSLSAQTKAWPEKSFQGTITSINPRINANNLTFTVRAVLNNASGDLRPGMLMAIHIQRPAQTVMSIPARSVLFQGSERYVYVVNDNNTVEERAIKTSQTIGDQIIVSEGLKTNDRIVDKGVVKVRTGQSVSIVPDAIATSIPQTPQNTGNRS